MRGSGRVSGVFISTHGTGDDTGPFMREVRDELAQTSSLIWAAPHATPERPILVQLT
jgi:hypothetical protein